MVVWEGRVTFLWRLTIGKLSMSHQVTPHPCVYAALIGVVKLHVHTHKYIYIYNYYNYSYIYLYLYLYIQFQQQKDRKLRDRSYVGEDLELSCRAGVGWLSSYIVWNFLKIKRIKKKRKRTWKSVTENEDRENLTLWCVCVCFRYTWICVHMCESQRSILGAVYPVFWHSIHYLI